MTFNVIAIIACVILSGLFSASEMAYSAASRVRLENLRDNGLRRAKLACRIVDHFDDALSAILIGNNFVNIAVSSLASVIALSLFGGYTALATVVVTIIVIIFGETMPKILAKKNANRTALAFSPVVVVFMTILKPIIFIVVGAVHLITRQMKGEQTDDEEESAVEELQSIIETAEDEEVIDEGRSELLLSALDFSEIMASEVMTARVDVVAIDIGDSYEENLKIIEDSPYSRLPVYDGSIDDIIGILALNRFFKAATETEKVDIHSLLMSPCYVYKTTKLPAVLNKMRKEKLHLAIVTDEYGGSMGVITMEDVLEQIVGEIWDETDEVEPEVVERSNGDYELDGDMNMSDFIELLGRDEDSMETESATVGGWTIERFGVFPEPGQSFDFENLHVTVLAMDGRRVEKVLIRVLEDI